MANRLQSVGILSLLITFGAGIRAQSPQPTSQDASSKAGTFSKRTEEKITPPQRVANLQGFGAVGQIPKFGGGDFLINSIIFESSSGKIGIGTQAPGSTLSVNGQIETLSGGVKFPDGSVQTTAGVSPMDALTAVAHDDTLTGAGTLNSPLRVASFVGQPFVAASGPIPQVNSLIEGLVTTVPAGKLLVIEQVTASCVLGAGERLIVLQLKIGPYRHALVSSFNGGTSAADFYASSQHVRLYAPAGASVYLSANRNDVNGPAQCDGTLTGSLIDQPGAN